MGILGALEKRMAVGPAGALDDSWYSPGGFLYGGGAGGAKTKAGSYVSEMTAMKLSVFWCCVKTISEDIASLPLHLYRRLKGGGKERATDHPLYSLLHDQPNPEMTSMNFRECGQSHLLSWGNSYCEIERSGGRINRTVALWPITPNRVTVKRNEKKQIEYKITMSGGAEPVILSKRNMLHVPGLGFNGLQGYSPVGYAREAIGLGLSLEEYGELYFGQGTHPGVVVSHPGKLSPDAHSNLKASLAETHSGLGKAHRLMLLEEAMKIEKLGIENKDAQFIESKKYSNIDIGTRIMRVPPYMYGEMEKSAWSNVEQQAIDYVVKTLRPWCVRMEQALNVCLLDPSEREEYFFEHLVDGLLRGDIESRYAAYAIGREKGWLNADEIREFENMNPMADGQGKIYLIPLNMIPASEAGTTKEPAKQQNGLNNRLIYRARIESAYHRIFSDAAERILRKEVKRLRWGMEKHGGNGNFAGFADEFYQEMPGFIKRTAFPAFMSFSETILGMESELNGLKLNGNKPQFERFVSDWTDRYASDHVSASRAALKRAVEEGKFDSYMDSWESERAEEIASTQASKLAGDLIGYLEGVMS